MVLTSTRTSCTATSNLESDAAIAFELIEFCLDRIYFVEDAIRSKECTYSPELVDFLKKVYPGHVFESNACRFEIDERTKRAIDYSLKKHHFSKGKLLALTLTLESVRTSHFLYDFEFGNSGRKEVVGNMEGSFDYHAQLGVPESA